MLRKMTQSSANILIPDATLSGTSLTNSRNNVGPNWDYQVLPWENGVQATLGLGFGHWEWEKMFEIKNGNGI